MSGEKKPICVVMDTNIWYQDSNLLLKTPMGSALLYILRQNGGKIGLPEIIEEELPRNIVEQGIKSATVIRKEFETIEKIMGFRSPYEGEHPTFAKIAKSPVFHLDKHTSNSRLHSLKQYSISLPKFGAFVQFA